MSTSHFNREFELPTWKGIHQLLLELAQRILRTRFKSDIIVGISRGGWPPARILSDLLRNPELANVKVEFYRDLTQVNDEPVITQPISVPVKNKKVLIVDDVADTGKSLACVRSYVNHEGASEVKIATIYYKPWSIVTPDWFGRATSKWIIFPWELKETVRSILEKGKVQRVSIEKAKEILMRSGLSHKSIERFIEEIVEEL